MITTVEQITANYFREQADVLFLVLSRTRQILETNRYTAKLLGIGEGDTTIADVIVDFSGSFSLAELSGDSTREHLLNVRTFTGLPQTFLCRVFDLQDQFLMLGKLDLLEIETLRRELVSSNNELNNLSRELQRKNVELARLNQLKNQFLGMAAHDLRNPISAILSYAEFIYDEAGDTLNEEHRNFLRVILTSSHFMHCIVDDFLDISMIESGKFELNLQSVNLREFLTQNLALHQVKARKKGLHIHFQCPETLPALAVDASKIEQVFNNLMTNAMGHSFQNGNIFVTVAPHDGEVTVSVRDEGPGIPPDEVKKLFAPFGRTSVRKTGGEKSTGLGLAISHKIIEAHQGTIGVESEPGKGSTFYFSLPFHEGGVSGHKNIF
jgi:signal transduction histidine kinase